MSLKREIGLFGATMMGLGAVVGTGVFVSIGIAAGIAGPAVIVSIAIAAAVATCNALSSAQLAANHSVSGGTYEYGYRYLSPWLGFAAGWVFLCAKGASAATAALGFAGYLLNALGGGPERLPYVAVGAVVVLTAAALAGVRLSSGVNVVIVAITLSALAAFVVAGAGSVSLSHLKPAASPAAVLHASALLFVAYTGYGRVATLGEEVTNPRRTIPRAIMLTLWLSMLLYAAVALVGVGAVGADALSAATLKGGAPLEVISRSFRLHVHSHVAIGAMTAMLGVLLNLLLGLSRVLLAMGRRGDMPSITARLPVAVLTTGGIIAALAATGSVKLTWSFSAFAVLVYYAVTNLAALRLGNDERLYRRLWAWTGLVACLLLAFSIEPAVWSAGLAVLVAGLLWRATRLALARRTCAPR